MAIPNPGYWYIDSVAYAAVTAWSTGAVKAAGAKVRQLATPSVGNERVFVCTVAGTTHASTEPTWVVTKGAATTDNTVTWTECTGQAALNGSLTYTSGWTNGPGGSGTGVKGQAVALGYIIARDSGASYQICTTAGTAGSGAEPSFSNTAGTTTADNTVTWTSLGVVGGFTTAFGAPHARLANAFAATWGAAGDIFWVGDNHAETQSTANTLTAPGTISNYNYIYGVDHTKTSPGTGDLLAGATISTTGNSAITFAPGYFYCYGIQFSSGSGAVIAAINIFGSSGSAAAIFDNCKMIKAGSSANGAAITVGGTSSTANYVIWNNTTVQFSAATDSMRVGGYQFIWKNTASAVVSGTLPTTLFSGTNTSFCRVFVQGVDFSALAAKTLIGAMATDSNYQFVDCQIAANTTVSATPTIDGAYIDIIRTDSGTVTSRQERYQYTGTQTLETTIVRSGGASDGTTPMSWKVASSANTIFVRPFQCFPIGIWNATTGSSVTATVEIVNDGTTLTDGDIWMEVEYLGTTSQTLGKFASGAKANPLASGANLSTSSVTWTTSGLGSPIKQKLTATFTPRLAGYLYGTVYVGLVSKTIYVDPLITLS